MKDLEQALAFANYQTTLNRERQLITHRFHDECIFAYNGGLFQISFEFLAALKTVEYKWLLDMNNNPIEIPNPPEFYKEAESLYNTAIEQFGESFKSLKSKRSVKSLVGL